MPIYNMPGKFGDEALPTVFGVAWNGTETTQWTRTDAAADFPDPVPYVAGASEFSSPFDLIQPWAGMEVVERTGGTMVSIPKFWYKLKQLENNGMSIKIANVPTDGFSVSPAHMDRGDGVGERDVVYIGRYHCANDFKSKTGTAPKAEITRSDARNTIHNLGTNIWQSDFAMRFTIWLLYLMEFADWNSQTKIGYGCGDGFNIGNVGYTDSMPYHTGTTQSSRTTYGLGTQYRNIEGLWDNVNDWMDGCYQYHSHLYLILNPSNFSDSSGGILVGEPSAGYPSKFTVANDGGFQMFYPSISDGSTSTYSCDLWDGGSDSPCLLSGGGYNQSASFGFFYVNSLFASSEYENTGCRIMELP